jgi:hypothetical protein
MVFIPTYEWWVGTQSNPWVIPDAISIRVLQTIWDVIFPLLPYTVTAGDAVIKQVCFMFLFFGGESVVDNMVGYAMSL